MTNRASPSSGHCSASSQFSRRLLEARGVVCRRLMMLVVASVGVAALAGCPGRVPITAQSGADYFRFDNGYAPLYERSSGQEEEHEYQVEGESPDGTLRFQRIANAGGFVEADRTMMFEVNEEELRIVSFLDCVNNCELLAAPQRLLPWPLDGGEVETFDVEVSVIENSAEVATQAETHRIAVGNEEEVTVPAGTFSGFDVLWTRTIDDGGARTARLFVVPEVGFVKVEGWNGATMELKTEPPALAE